MGRYVFRLPDVGEGMAEAEIGDWHVAVGSVVEEDQPLVDMMTDKATVEITSPVSGTVVTLHGAKGDKRPIGSDLVVLEIAGGDNAAPAATAPKPVAAPVAPPKPPPRAEPPPVAETPVANAERVPEAPLQRRPDDESPQASPAVRRAAHEAGVELQFVSGSGPGGRITMDDLQAFLESRGTQAARPATRRREGVEDIPVIGLRRKIAERMQDTKRRIPHFTYVEEIDVTALEQLRATLNARHAGRRAKLTLLPFLVRALCVALPDFPQINATFDDVAGVVHRHAAVHAGIATQTPTGLVVVVVQHAEALSVWEIAEDVGRLAGLARAGKAGKSDMTGSTITVTSLGAMGGVVSTPILNQPEVGIIGVNKMIDRPMVVDGRVEVRTMMNLSSSFDHRVVDGWDAAAFIQSLKQLLETPAMLFMDPA